jgi:hypothetical protein
VLFRGRGQPRGGICRRTSMTDAEIAPTAQARTRSRVRGAVLRVAGTIAGAVVGALPALIVGSILIKPHPASGFDNLGPGFLTIGLGVLGVITGTVAGFIYTGRRLGRPGIPQTTRGTVAVLLAVVVGTCLLFVSPPLSLLIPFGLAVAAISQSRNRHAASMSASDESRPLEPFEDG